MATGTETATFSVVLDDQVSTSADRAAESVEELRERMLAGESSVKEMGAALRRLKGSTEEVTRAKAELKAKIAAERDAVSAAQLAMLKQGDAAKKLAAQTKELAKQKQGTKGEAKKLGTELGLTGTAAKLLKEKLLGMKGAAAESGGALDITKAAALGLYAAAAAAAVAVAACGISLVKFIVGAANAARSAGLMREAVAGSAQQGAALNSQIDALSRKVPTSRAALDELGASLRRNGLGGQAFVDTLNAVGQASAALGDEAGNKLKTLIERGRQMGNFSIGDDTWSDDLRGSGLQRDDVAKSLAKNMKIGVAEARAALMSGRVKLADGAKALRDAVESKFGGINLRKMLDLNVIAQKLKERFDSLTNRINLEPLLKGFSQLADLFDESTATGAALKEIVTLMGNTLGAAVGGSAPLMKRFFQGMIIATLHLAIAMLTLRNRFRDAFHIDNVKRAKALETAFTAGKYALIGLVGVAAVGITFMAAQLALVGGAIYGVVSAFQFLYGMVETAYNIVKDKGWSGLGVAIVDGIIDGLKSKATRLIDVVKNLLAGNISGAFKTALGIGSPSKVFAGYGKNTVEGFEEGVEARAPEAAKALDRVTNEPEGAGARRGAGAKTVTVNMPITIHAHGADAAKAVSSSSFLDDLMKNLGNALVTAGVPA